MQSKTGSLKHNMPLIFLGIILAYIVGGAIFVFDEKLFHGKAYILFMICVSLVISALLILIKNTVPKIRAAYDDFIGLWSGASDRKEFRAFYNIADREMIMLIVIIFIGLILRMLGLGEVM